MSYNESTIEGITTGGMLLPTTETFQFLPRIVNLLTP